LFTGEFAHTIDAKQRLAIPAELRSTLASMRGADDEPTVLFGAPGPNGALWLWPESTFEAMASAVDSDLVPTDEQMSFDELFFPLAARLQIDSAGRIRVPERLLAQAELGSAVVILGMRDHLELRDQVKWDEHRARLLPRAGEIMLRARQAARGGGAERP
jgi:MraZ protein